LSDNKALHNNVLCWLLMNANSSTKTGEALENEGSRITETKTITAINGEHRAALSVSEFSALFGKHQSWGYRRIYKGEVKIIIPSGTMLIPASEVKRLLDMAEIYEGGDE
jgi:hypothetical protein